MPVGSKSISPARLLVPALILALALWPDAGSADPPGGPNQLRPERWRNLPPDQRHELRRRYLQALPEEERAQLRDQARRFKSLPGPRKRELCRRFHRERGYLPPACQRLLDR